MLGICELKESIKVTKNSVECPVKKCNVKVERQRVVFKREERFKCPIHNIYISPSTFEYNKEKDNFLWKNNDDIALFNNIKAVKRESRISRDNSEDAVTWNVLRFLERNGFVETFLQSIIGIKSTSSEVIYWSFSQKEKSSWSELNIARNEFGEEIKRSSEPDIIILTNNTLIFIESKLTAGNKTVPSNINNPKKYITGGNNWFKEVIRTDYNSIAIIDKKYELMRFWLLGTWMASRLNLNFYLVNLVLHHKEKDIERVFKKHIIENKNRQFFRITWEDIYLNIKKNNIESIEKDKLMKYFLNKTIGYDTGGRLQKAFFY